MTDQPEHRIVISPIGDFDAEFFKQISKEINRIFGYPTEIISVLKEMEFAFDSDRNQYHSTPILEKLADLAPLQAVRLLAIIRVDLFIPILTHVYGEAQLGGKACIVSTHRLNEGLSSVYSDETYRRRIVKEAIHELGHTFNLRHCQEYTCIMHYCRSIQDVDRKSDQLCRYCKILLTDEIKRLAENSPPAL